jgi:hypothetical protein
MKNAGEKSTKRDEQSFFNDYNKIINALKTLSYPQSTFEYIQIQGLYSKLHNIFAEAQKATSTTLFTDLKIALINDLDESPELNEKFSYCANGLRVKHNFIPTTMSNDEEQTLIALQTIKEILTPTLAEKGHWRPYIHRERQNGTTNSTSGIKFVGHTNEIYPFNDQLSRLNAELNSLKVKTLKTKPLMDSRGRLLPEGIDVIIPQKELSKLVKFKELGYKFGEKKFNLQKKAEYDLSPPPPTLSEKVKKDNGKGKGRQI